MNTAPLHETITIRVDPALAERLERLRRERDLNVSSFARRALIAALDREYPIDLEDLSRAVSRS